MSSLVRLSAFEMRTGLLAGDFSAPELLDAHLRHIEQTNPELNSFLNVAEDQARNAAKQAELTLKSQKENSPLLTGIPIAVKDQLVTKDIETTCGSKILKGFIPPYDCTAVLRLKVAGAIVLGKTNQDEFAMGSSTEYSAYGPTKNPWDTSRVPGGSSGGSAAAVASGQAPIALGTDTGGSIRQPAALTGIFGLKPTYGRVSRYGAVAYASSLDQIGPFARTLEDLALCLEVIAGADEADSTSMKIAVPEYVRNLKEPKENLSGLKIGVPKEYSVEGMEADVEACFRSNLDTLSSLGAEIVEISLPHTQYALAAYYITAPAEASSNLARYDGIRYGYRTERPDTLHELYQKTRAEGFGTEVKRRIMIGSFVLSAGYYDAYYRKAQQIRTLILNDFKAAFANKCDIIATPVSPTTAFRLGEKMTSPLTMYLADIFTVPVNLAGLPGLSLPAGLSGEKLPIGLQFIGAPFTEGQLLSVAKTFSNAIQFDTAARIQ